MCKTAVLWSMMEHLHRINACTCYNITLLCNFVTILVCVNMPFGVFKIIYRCVPCNEFIVQCLTTLGLRWWEVSGNPTREFKLFQDRVLEAWLPSPEIWLWRYVTVCSSDLMHIRLVGLHRAASLQWSSHQGLSSGDRTSLIHNTKGPFQLHCSKSIRLVLTCNSRLLCISWFL